MSALTDAWAVWTAEVEAAAPLPNRARAIDILIADGPTLKRPAAGDWWDAMALEYNRLGIIKNTDYDALRSEVTRQGAAISNELFGALQGQVTVLDETAKVVAALEEESLVREQAQIPLDIAKIEEDRDKKADPVLIDAYNEGIKAKERRLGEINAILAEAALRK